MNVSIIISTYNQPGWLEKVLWGYGCQSHPDFELLIADDGSTEETRRVIERLKTETGMRTRHLWHEDRGYRRQRILNRALAQCDGDYVVVTDGDCVPRADFVKTHVEIARKEHFVSGGYCKLPLSLSSSIEKEHIISGRSFDAEWLKTHGLRGRSQLAKLKAHGAWKTMFNTLTTTRATWNNCNSAGWKSDLVKVNGFDERMQYGGADRELGERLLRLGLRSIQARYSIIVLHLDHPRGYAKPELISWNKRLRRANARTRTTWTEHGLVKGPATDPA